MGWEDRPYHRDRSGSSTTPLGWLISGSVPLFNLRGTKIRIHAILLLFVAMELAYGFNSRFGFYDRAIAMSALVALVFVHEMSHCFMARRFGGVADEIVMMPFGGLPTVQPPERLGPVFWTAAVGPILHLAICLGSGFALDALTHVAPPINPFDSLYRPTGIHPGSVGAVLWWIYIVSFLLLLVNLIPMLPLDGGQAVQALLAHFFGQHRSVHITAVSGMAVGATVLLFSVVPRFYPLMMFVGVVGIIYCWQRRHALLEVDAEQWGGPPVDFNASIYPPNETKPKRRRVNRRALKRARKIAHQEQAARERIDAILAKVSTHGLAGLHWRERRALRKATERNRRTEMEFSKFK